MSAPLPNGLVLGIDAGNTKTVALVADTAGRVLGWGRAGRGNIYVSKRDALAAIDKAALAALSGAGARPDQLAASVLSATGADWPEDVQLLEEELARRAWGERRLAVNDAVGALRAASPDGSGVMVVCGTSAGIAARAPGGRAWHTGYWQEPEGAEQLGQLTLRAVYRAALGIDSPTSLTARVLAHYHLEGVESLLHAFTRRDRRPPGRPGRLARLLLDEAQLGDATAARLVQEHGEALGDYALASARRAGLTGAFALYTAGGVMRHPAGLLQEALLSRVRRDVPGATLTGSQHEPVVGAVLLALDALGLEGPALASLPSEALYRT